MYDYGKPKDKCQNIHPLFFEMFHEKLSHSKHSITVNKAPLFHFERKIDSLLGDETDDWTFYVLKCMYDHVRKSQGSTENTRSTLLTSAIYLIALCLDLFRHQVLLPLKEHHQKCHLIYPHSLHLQIEIS